jgi:hypothetical protein
MRAAKVLAVLAIAALGIGSLSAVALAGKEKKKTTVVFNQTGDGVPKISTSKVNVKGHLNTVSACQPGRAMRLQVLDANGVVLHTHFGHPFIGRSTSDSRGNWSLAGEFRKMLPPTGTNYVRVRAKKRTVGKFVCQVGFSRNVAIPAA